MKVGVLALQGSFAEHAAVCEDLGYEVVDVRSVEDLEEISHLIIPGGESTTMVKLLKRFGMWEVLEKKLDSDSLKIFGTCAGAILCSYLGMNLVVERNAYGAQQDSMVASLNSDEFENLRGAFIRAPKFLKIGDMVKVLATQNNDPVLVEEGNFLAASFHPELVGEGRIYEYFLGE